MADLVLEPSLTLLAATLIGWLIGRFLCKSGEYDERAERRRLSHELQALTQDLEASRQAADGLRRQLAEQVEATARIEQERTGSSIRVEAMKRQQQELLGGLQALEVCNARLGALGTELDERQGLVVELKATCTAQADRIRTMRETLDGTRARLEDSDARERLRQEELAGLHRQQADAQAAIASPQHEKSGLELQLRQLGGDHRDCTARLRVLVASIDRLYRRSCGRGAERS